MARGKQNNHTMKTRMVMYIFAFMLVLELFHRKTKRRGKQNKKKPIPYAIMHNKRIIPNIPRPVDAFGVDLLLVFLLIVFLLIKLSYIEKNMMI